MLSSVASLDSEWTLQSTHSCCSRKWTIHPWFYPLKVVIFPHAFSMSTKGSTPPYFPMGFSRGFARRHDHIPSLWKPGPWRTLGRDRPGGRKRFGVHPAFFQWRWFDHVPEIKCVCFRALYLSESPTFRASFFVVLVGHQLLENLPMGNTAVSEI